MARLSRYTQQTFGTSAGVNQMAEFGSFAAGTPLTYSGATITPTIVQTLSQYASGWFSAIVGANSPCIEDWNSICYLFAYQLTYLMQLGVPEWDSGTTYYTGSIAQDGAGNLYVSLTNANLNNALSNATNWRPYGATINLALVNPTTGTYASPYAMSASDIGKCFLVESNLGTMTFNLPNPALMPNGFNFTVKDQAGSFAANNCTIHRFATENLEGLAADYVIQASGGEWEISTDNTNWYIVGR